MLILVDGVYEDCRDRLGGRGCGGGWLIGWAVFLCLGGVGVGWSRGGSGSGRGCGGGWLIGWAVFLCLGGVGVGWSTSQRRRRRSS